MSYAVVIPAFNAEATLAVAIRSLLEQTLPPERVVVVDDGSTDGTGAVAKGFGSTVHLVRQDNAGPGAVERAGGIPRNDETPGYVRDVLRHWRF